MTSKFFPINQPPWQVHIINHLFNGKQSSTCLVRVHHLLLQKEQLTLADFLPLEYLELSSWCGETINSPFTDIYTKPSALPKFYQKFTESFNNYWNEFICNNDPRERHDILQNHIGLFHCFKIIIIIIVATIKQVIR